MAHPAKHRQASQQLAAADGTSDVPRVLIVEDELRYAVDLMRALTEPVSESKVRLAVEFTPNPEVATTHAQRDDIDVYIVDLKFKNPENPLLDDERIGKALVRQILETTNAGLIVHSTLPAREHAVDLLELGADDYIEKMSREGATKRVRQERLIKIEERTLQEIIRAKVVAVWRRVQMGRPVRFPSVAHIGRKFLVGEWLFTIGNRELTHAGGQKTRLSASEHALLRYLCTVQGHQVDVPTINLEVLSRPPADKDKRVDNYILRMRQRLGKSFELLSQKDGTYKLATVTELPKG